MSNSLSNSILNCHIAFRAEISQAMGIFGTEISRLGTSVGKFLQTATRIVCEHRAYVIGFGRSSCPSSSVGLRTYSGHPFPTAWRWHNAFSDQGPSRYEPP